MSYPSIDPLSCKQLLVWQPHPVLGMPLVKLPQSCSWNLVRADPTLMQCWRCWDVKVHRCETKYIINPSNWEWECVACGLVEGGL